jgi:hypothetical protein
MFDKELAIQSLVDDDLNTILSYNDDNWILSEMLVNGFKGYSNYTDQELMQELKERGLEEGYNI